VIRALNRRRNVAVTARPAFTLVEVMVVLVLISILSTMVMTAVQGVTQNARLARTRSIVAVIDSVLQEQYESYKYRPLAVAIPDLNKPLPNEGIFSFQLMPSEAARVRLNMVRDLQRMELPDRINDVATISGTTVSMNFPATLTAVAYPVMQMNGRMQRGDDGSRRQFPVNWFNGAFGKNVPSRFAAYFRRVRPTWTPQHQGSECLYLIMSNSFVGGSSALDAIPPSNIGDTDNDGMPEILDGWERPIEFVRWPNGFGSTADSELSVDLSLPDDFDLFRSDFGYSVSGVVVPWSMRPLVVSAGSDGEHGLNFVPRDAGGNEVGFRYSTLMPATGLRDMSWPVTPAAMGTESTGRTATYFWLDPYMRQTALGVATYPGNPLPNSQSVRDDNITNYQLATE
jgi:prepilin-type N-terminal cleavage/methylation domain-containing protein